MLRLTMLLLLLLDGGRPQVIGPSRPIVATVGDDIMLPCHLEPAVNASDMRLEWARPDLSPGFVHVRANGQEYVAHKQPSYRGRTSVSVHNLKHGDVSLKLSEVKVSDEGTYRCLVPSLGRAAFIKLVVGAVSSPVIHMAKNSSTVMLDCESEGWYPEPEVLWLDAEGNLLSAGPTETVRGPDDLYTVSSRLTVEKRHSNNFTCRVQQKDIHQTRETQIHVAADVFIDKYSSPWFWGFILGVAALLYLFILRKICNKRKQEIVEKVTNMVKRNNIKSNSPQLSRLTEQEEEQENQGSTGEGRERADQQEKEKRNTELTNKLRKTEEPLKTNVTSKALQTGRDEEQQLRRRRSRRRWRQ